MSPFFPLKYEIKTSMRDVTKINDKDLQRSKQYSCVGETSSGT